MGLFKEHAVSFEKINNQQSQIYNDSCDYGVCYDTNNISQDVKSLFYFINDLKDSSLITNRTEYENSVTITIEIIWSIEDGIQNGTKYTIMYNKLVPHVSIFPMYKKFDAYVNVDISNFSKRV